MKEVDKMYVRELRTEVRVSRGVIKGLQRLLDKEKAKNKKLQDLDDALRDYNFEKVKKMFEDFQKEGFKEVVDSRPLVRRNI